MQRQLLEVILKIKLMCLKQIKIKGDCRIILRGSRISS